MSSRIRPFILALGIAGIASVSSAQQIDFFVNIETGANVAGCGTPGQPPCRSISFLLPTIVLSPTQNARVLVAGRKAEDTDIPIIYDESNGESFPLVLTDRVALAYDPNNSEFFPGGARVPAIVRKTINPAVGIVIRISAVPGAPLGRMTGLDGQTAGVGLRLLHVENGEFTLLIDSTGMATNDACVRGVTLRNGDDANLCILGQDGGATTTSLADYALTTNVDTGSMLKVLAWNPTVPSTSTRATVSVDGMDISADQVGGIGVSNPGDGIVLSAVGITGGSPRVEFDATGVNVSGFANTDPANPLGLDRGITLSATGPGDPAVKATIEGTQLVSCGRLGAFHFPQFGGLVQSTLSNMRLLSCGIRPIPGEVPDGHGISTEAVPGGSLDLTVQSSYIENSLLAGVFVYPNAAAGPPAQVTARIVSNEIVGCGRDGVRFEGGNAMVTSSTVQSNRIHDNMMKGIRLLATASGIVFTQTLVNNLVYGNGAGGIEINGDGASVTMTHNTVVDNFGIGVLVVGANTSGTSFWNGISWHVTIPSDTDLSGFGPNQVNYSTWENCAVGQVCSGTDNLPGIQPQFVNVAAADYHLVNNDATNFMVDAARNDPLPPAGPMFDFEGDLRALDIGMSGPVGKIADMGADEARP